MVGPYTALTSEAITQAKRSNKRSCSTSGRGYTMIEVVVMLAIVTAISTVVLISFTGLNEGGAVNRSARELALAIRRAQNMSLAVTQVQTSSGPRIPPAVGLKLDRSNPTSYFTFADLVLDNKYVSAGDAQIGVDETFPRGTRINLLTGPTGSPHTIVYIMFAAPEAVVTLSDINGASIGDKAEIEIVSASGLYKKRITVRTSGQVGIK